MKTTAGPGSDIEEVRGIRGVRGVRGIYPIILPFEGRDLPLKVVILNAVKDPYISSLFFVVPGSKERKLETPHPTSEAAESIAFASTPIFLLRFSAQKSHVKPLTHLTPFPTTTSPCRLVTLNPLYLI
jgi:hypothetical protein